VTILEDGRRQATENDTEKLLYIGPALGLFVHPTRERCAMLSRRSMILSLLIAAGVGRPAFAQNAGDPVTVQFGSYLAPTATREIPPFMLSHNCYPWTTPAHVDCRILTYVYSADVFAAALAPGESMMIDSFTFFSATNNSASLWPNFYHVFLGATRTGYQYFGALSNGNPVCGISCSRQCSLTRRTRVCLRALALWDRFSTIRLLAISAS
jgi:hypothetical protein